MTKEKVAKEKAEGAEQACKVVKAFWALKELANEKAKFTVESYIVRLQEYHAKFVEYFPKLNLWFLDAEVLEDLTLPTLMEFGAFCAKLRAKEVASQPGPTIKEAAPI